MSEDSDRIEALEHEITKLHDHVRRLAVLVESLINMQPFTDDKQAEVAAIRAASKWSDMHND